MHRLNTLSKKLVTVAVLLILLVAPSQVSAASDFSTSLINTQTVDLKGNTHVEKSFSIKNNRSTVYIKKYGVEINSNKISNVKVLSHGTALKANIVKTETSTTVGIEFPDLVVGKDKERTFSIEYDDPDAAIISGNVLEVYAPKIADPTKFDEYSAVLKIPAKFGKPTIANPSQYTVTSQDGFNVLNFDREAENDGISVIFGDKQFFDFSLDYNLKNTTSNRGIMQIALPPDTDYQKVNYSEINPRPEKVEIDEDGNWIATYVLEGAQQITVKAKGIVSIHLDPEVDIPLIKPQPKHTEPDIHWEVKDPFIQKIAQKNSTPHQIFNFVVDTLTYNNARIATNIDRQGAKQALENPKNAVCQEFTDVFVTLARANGIPARQATGYAFTNNAEIRPLSLVKDVLHAWPEYFDETKQRWIPVDPTWTNTTGGIDYFNHLDFSHFVFAYQGVSSEKPYPAGSYKTGADDEGKSVFVTVTDHELPVSQNFNVSVKEPFSSFFNLLGKNTLVVTNNTGSAWYNVPLSLSASSQIDLSLPQPQIERLLPYQSVEVPFSAIGQSWFSTSTYTIQVMVGEKTTSQQVIVSSKLQQFNISPEYIAYFSGSFVFTAVLVFYLFYTYKKFAKKRAAKKLREEKMGQQ